MLVLGGIRARRPEEILGAAAFAAEGGEDVNHAPDERLSFSTLFDGECHYSKNRSPNAYLSSGRR